MHGEGKSYVTGGSAYLLDRESEYCYSVTCLTDLPCAFVDIRNR